MKLGESELKKTILERPSVDTERLEEREVGEREVPPGVGFGGGEGGLPQIGEQFLERAAHVREIAGIILQFVVHVAPLDLGKIYVTCARRRSPWIQCCGGKHSVFCGGSWKFIIVFRVEESWKKVDGEHAI